jgi:hypothetical protein
MEAKISSIDGSRAALDVCAIAVRLSLFANYSHRQRINGLRVSDMQRFENPCTGMCDPNPQLYHFIKNYEPKDESYKNGADEGAVFTNAYDRAQRPSGVRKPNHLSLTAL